VLHKRIGHAPGENQEQADTLMQGEAARIASAAATPPAKPEEEKVSLFWRIFGGTILSMVTLGVLTLYNNISGNIAELRSELSREREARSELVRKDEFNSRHNSQYERIRAFDSMKAEQEGLKERVNANTAAVDAVKKDAAAAIEAIRKDTTAVTDLVKKDAAAIEIVKERLTALETLKKDVASLELLREKLATVTAELKTLKDDSAKIQQEQERNKVADLERKANRDAQHKQLEETLKELQKGVQDCREKLARLEGPRGTGTPVEPPPTLRPASPAGEAREPLENGAGNGKTNSGGPASESKPGPATPPM
jgi:DNA repair exonuclease SbcCD ATPase subunit